MLYVPSLVEYFYHWCIRQNITMFIRTDLPVKHGFATESPGAKPGLSLLATLNISEWDERHPCPHSHLTSRFIIELYRSKLLPWHRC